MGYHPHYSGGFWWAKASYVATCLDLKYLDHPLRFMREFFIGSGKPNEKEFLGIKSKQKRYCHALCSALLKKDI